MSQKAEVVMQNPHHTVTVFNSYYTELDMFDVYSVVLI
jgi:hypothetical protein